MRRMPAVPLFKLLYLVAKQVAKPAANYVGTKAKECYCTHFQVPHPSLRLAVSASFQSSPFFRNRVCIPLAQWLHRLEVNSRMRSLNLGKAKKVPKLNEEEAVENGAQILTEGIILVIALGYPVYEIMKTMFKEEKKDDQAEQREREVAYLQGKVQDLEFRLEQQTVDVKQLTRLTHALKDELHKGTLKGWFKRNVTDREIKEEEISTKPETALQPPTEAKPEGSVPTKLVAFNENKLLTQDTSDEGIVLDAVTDLLGPAEYETSYPSQSPDSFEIPFSPYQKSGDKFTKSLVIEGADYFLHGCQED